MANLKKIILIEKFREYITLDEVIEYFELNKASFEYKLHTDSIGFHYFWPIICHTCTKEIHCKKENNNLWDKGRFKLFKFKRDHGNKYVLWMRICLKFQKK